MVLDLIFLSVLQLTIYRFEMCVHAYLQMEWVGGANFHTKTCERKGWGALPSFVITVLWGSQLQSK